MMNQRFATVSTLLAVLNNRGVKYELNGPTPISEVLSETDKKQVRDFIFAGFRKGEIEMSEEGKAKHTEDAKLKAYVSGLVNNWIRKAPEFNNGGKYVAKNPGSRQGSGDSQVREMKKLLSQTEDPTTKSVIQQHINDRVAELKPANSTPIDASKLPESLRHLAK